MAAAALLAVAVLLAGCADPAPNAEDAVGTPGEETAVPLPAVVSERDGPSWAGELGQAVRIDWHDPATGDLLSEEVAVLAVRRVANPYDDGGPDEFGDGYGPYEWKYGIKVRLTSLDARAARRPVAYQFLQLSDGRRTEDGVSGLAEARGPDPSQPGKSSVGWLYQWAEQGFRPTEVLLPVGVWQVTWSLGAAPQPD